MRTIDAGEAEKIILERSQEMRDKEPALSGALAAAIGFLDKCKTVDAVPAVHGRWISSGGFSDDTCSVCGSGAGEMDCNHKFCFSCGARMDGAT